MIDTLENMDEMDGHGIDMNTYIEFDKQKIDYPLITYKGKFDESYDP